MKAVVVLVVTWTVLVPQILTRAQAAADRDSRVSVSYVPPKDPAHRAIYEQLGQLRFLEKLQRLLTPFRLPRALLVKLEGCDGDANAFYESNVITVCYEYIDQLWKTMPAQTTAAGVTPPTPSWVRCSTPACMNSPTPCSSYCACRCSGARKTPPTRYLPTSCCISGRPRRAG